MEIMLNKADTTISKVVGREILDCKGRPALEVDIYTRSGRMDRAASPAGISAGCNEACVLRGSDPSWYKGMGVTKALERLETVIAPALLGMDVMDWEAIDRRLLELDSSPTKAFLGGNTTYSVSLACLKTAAVCANQPLYRFLAGDKPIRSLPLPTFNCIDGGSFQKGTMPFQECTVIPYKAATMQEAVHIGWSIYQGVGEVITEYQNGRPAKLGEVTGWQPPSPDPVVCFDLLYETARRLGVEDKVAFAADCASSEFYIPERNTYDFLEREIDLDEMLGILKGLTEKYPFLYVEDAVQENDWDGWCKASKILTKTVLIGDDFTVTNRNMLRKAHELQACGGFIFKPNQVGTVTEALEAHAFAKEHNMLTIPSIRSGGTVGDSVIEMAIAIGAAATKQGPPKSGERVFGLNALLRAASENPEAVPYDFTPFIRF